MIMTVSLYALMMWFVWGLSMGLGWAIAHWLFSKVISL